MTEVELRQAIAKRKRRPPIHVEEAFIAEVQAARNALSPVLKKREQHARLWKQLIEPAVAELRNVQHMQKLVLTYPTLERTQALAAYAGLITQLIKKFRVHIDKVNITKNAIDDSLLTPGQHAKLSTRAFPNGKPNGGRFWVDWVPPNRVEQVQALFDVIPRTRGVRQKVPFPVVLDKQTSAKRRAVLIQRTSRELEYIERLMAAELADTRLTDTHVFKHQEIGAMRLQVSQMQSALHIISLLPPNAYIPPTWHGVMTARTRPGERVIVTPKQKDTT